MVEKNSRSEEIQKEKSRKYSIIEGSFASVSNGAGEQYVVPYALALNSSNAQIGFLSSFVGLIGASSQVVGSKLMFKYSRKTLIVTFVALQAFMWLIVLSLGLLYMKGILTSFYAASLLIVFYVIYAIFGSLAGPPWFSLMGDLAPEKTRGTYFSRRNKICGTVAMVTALFASFFLDYFKGLGWVILGFVILFAISSLGRFISAYYFTKHYYPQLKVKKDTYFSFFQFVKKAPGNNFGKFVIFVGLINVATHFASPFFAVYMLKELHYSYLWFTLVNLAGSLFTILSIPIWGKIGDKYGNRELLRIGSFITPLIPFFWIFSVNPLFIIFTAQLLAGLGWAAFNLGASNFIYDSVTPEKRGLCVAYYNMINGICIFIGAMAGGLFAQYIVSPFFGLNVFLWIFIISGIGRALVSLIMMPRIKEVRQVDGKRRPSMVGYLDLFTLKPLSHLFRGVYITTNEIYGVIEKDVKKL